MSCGKYEDLMHEVQDLLEGIPEEETPVPQGTADAVDPEEDTEPAQSDNE